MQYLDGYYLMLMDGTEYFSSEKLQSPFCMEKTNSATGITTYYLQTLGVVLAHPDRKEVIPLMPEAISKQDGQTKNDCEINASKRFLSKFRKDHPHLKVIVCQDAISPMMALTSVASTSTTAVLSYPSRKATMPTCSNNLMRPSTGERPRTLSSRIPKILKSSTASVG